MKRKESAMHVSTTDLGPDTQPENPSQNGGRRVAITYRIEAPDDYPALEAMISIGAKVTRRNEGVATEAVFSTCIYPYGGAFSPN